MSAGTHVDPSTSVLDHDDFPSGELAGQILDSLASAVAVIDPSGLLIATNATWRQWALNPVDGLAGLAVGQNFIDVCRGHGTADRAVGDHVADGTLRVVHGRAPRFEIQFVVPGVDTERWYMLVVTQLADLGAVVSRTETTPHHAVQSVVSDLAFHDPLTGLPNRWLVLDRLRMAVDRSERTQSWTTVVFADLDEFKAINDTLGHGAGDEVLATVARRLRSTLRVGDTCGRWGGDEFVMVLELEESTVIDDIMRRLQAAFVLPIAVGDGTVSVSASLGVAMAQSFASIDQLLKLADDAMYRSKQCGHATVFTVTADNDPVMTEL